MLRVVQSAASRPAPTTRFCAPVKFSAPTEKELPSEFSPQVPVFYYNDTPYVLIHQLAELWNFPSSYQLICRMMKQTGLPKKEFVHATDSALNKLLAKRGILSPKLQNSKLFYMELELLHKILDDDSFIFGAPAAESREAVCVPDIPEEELITVSQVFPGYENVEETLPMTFSSFLSLNPLTKLQMYKHEGVFRKVCGTNMSAFERELVCTSNNYFSDEVINASTESSSSLGTKPLGRQRKAIGNIDPNKADVTENLLPGAGQIPEFNVTSLCKVPNYFVTTNSMNSSSQNANPVGDHLKKLQLLPEDEERIPPQLYQTLANTDQEAYFFKYYYFKNYRGPGSGNYKDAALVTKINRIKRFTKETAPKSNKSTHMSADRVTKPPINRGERPIKGLVHDFFNHENIEIVTGRQRIFTEDFTNLEMLHNNISFNLLLNAYRGVASDTWKSYYEFKNTNFEKIFEAKRWRARQQRKMELWERRSELRQGSAEAVELGALLKPDLSQRFVLPTAYPEVMQKLPVELRGDENDPETSISRPIRYTATYADSSTPQVLNQIEVLKLPNPNTIGWDNLRKYANE